MHAVAFSLFPSCAPSANDTILLSPSYSISPKSWRFEMKLNVDLIAAKGRDYLKNYGKNSMVQLQNNSNKRLRFKLTTKVIW